MNNEIYRNLYDISQNNLREYNGKILPLSTDLFTLNCNMDSRIVDINNLMNVPLEDFICSAFVVILRRMPERQAILEWGKRLVSMNEMDFKKSIVKTLIGSAEFAEKKFISKNNFYEEYSMKQNIPLYVDCIKLKSHEDEDFVNEAYLNILGREADSEGRLHYVKSLKNKRLTKDDVILQLRYSLEGNNKKVTLINIEPSKFEVMSICLLDGEDFVRVAYRWLLERDADEGMYQYLRELKTGGLSKEEILYSISSSQEGKKHHIKIPGLKLRYYKIKLIRYIKNIPVIGRVLISINSIEEIKKEIDLQKNRYEKISSNLNNITNQISRLSNIYNEYQVKIKNMNSEINQMAENIENLQLKVFDIFMQKEDYYSIDYFDFENHFRGSRDYVKSVQEIYLPYFQGKTKVFDLGCGRGEFTELLYENGIGVIGVDKYKPYVEYMQKLGLPVVENEAIAFLREQSLTDGIFLGQVVEHLAISQIIEICELAYKKLDDKAYLIIETPNPQSLSIFTNAFYLDPSHQKPIHPLALKYIVEKAGFKKVDILYTKSSRVREKIPEIFPNDADFVEFNKAMQVMSEKIFCSQDYALIAQK